MSDDPFDRLDAEAARLDAFYDGLTAGQWAAPTRCPGWDRKAVLAHLIGIEDYIRAGLDGTVDEYASQAGAGVGYERLNNFLIERHADTPPDRLLEQWRDRVAELHPRLRQRGTDGTIDTQAGDYPLGRQAWYFATELAIHADDVAVPVAAGERDDRLAWRLEFAARRAGRVRAGRHGGAGRPGLPGVVRRRVVAADTGRTRRGGLGTARRRPATATTAPPAGRAGLSGRSARRPRYLRR